MTETSDTAVAFALLESLQALATSLSLTVAMPNVVFEGPNPVPGAQWLRSHLMPAPKIGLGIGAVSANQIYGILQVDAVAFPGGGLPPVMRLAQHVQSWFPRFTDLIKDSQRVMIYKTPYMGPLIKDDPWIFIPVSVPYRAFTNNPA